MKLALATANEGKVREFRAALAHGSSFEGDDKGTHKNYEIVSALELGVSDFPEETGSSYVANALTKASFLMQRCGLPSLGDDSGLEVEALGGAPGLYSARFGDTENEKMTDGARTSYLLEQLRGVPEEARGAQFVCVLGFTTPDGEVQTFEGRVGGVILFKPRGEHGFGYDPVFYSPELGKTFAEASITEKAGVSHRGRALAALAAWLQKTPL